MDVPGVVIEHSKFERAEQEDHRVDLEDVLGPWEASDVLEVDFVVGLRDVVDLGALFSADVQVVLLLAEEHKIN